MQNALEEAIKAGQEGRSSVEEVLRVLVQSPVFVPSRTAWPQVSPLFLRRGSADYLAVFSAGRQEASAALSAPYLLQVTAADVLAHLPAGFGLVVNPGSEPGMQIEAENIPQILTEFVSSQSVPSQNRAEDGPLLHTIFLETYAKCLRFLPDGETVVCIQFQEISLWHSAGRQLSRQSSFGAGFKRLYGLAVSPDGTRLAAVGEPLPGEGHLSLWTLPQGEKEKEFTFPDTYLLSAAFSPGGARLLAAGNEEVLHVVSLHTGKTEFALEYDDEDEDYWGLGERNTSIVYHPDGKTVLITACFQAGTQIVFCELDTALTPRPDLTIRLPADEMMGAAFSPDGRFFACADWDLHLYQFPSQERRWYFDVSGKRHDGAPLDRGGKNVEQFWTDALFTPDGQTLICGSPTGAIYFWDVPSGDLRRTLTGHDGGVLSLALNPAGTQLVSSGRDKTLRLWQVPAS